MCCVLLKGGKRTTAAAGCNIPDPATTVIRQRERIDVEQYTLTPFASSANIPIERVVHCYSRSILYESSACISLRISFFFLFSRLCCAPIRREKEKQRERERAKRREKRRRERTASASGTLSIDAIVLY